MICNFVSTSPGVMSKPQDAVPIADINCLWELDNEGLVRPEMSILDKNVIDFWDETYRTVEVHYELPIPWKNPSEELPNNCVPQS